MTTQAKRTNEHKLSLCTDPDCPACVAEYKAYSNARYDERVKQTTTGTATLSLQGQAYFGELNDLLWDSPGETRVADAIGYLREKYGIEVEREVKAALGLRI